MCGKDRACAPNTSSSTTSTTATASSQPARPPSTAPWRHGLILRWLMPPEPKRRRISPRRDTAADDAGLRKRLQRQAPLFAAQLEQQILAARPEYYGLPKP